MPKKLFVPLIIISLIVTSLCLETPAASHAEAEAPTPDLAPTATVAPPPTAEPSSTAPAPTDPAPTETLAATASTEEAPAESATPSIGLSPSATEASPLTEPAASLTPAPTDTLAATDAATVTPFFTAAPSGTPAILATPSATPSAEPTASATASSTSTAASTLSPAPSATWPSVATPTPAWAGPLALSHPASTGLIISQVYGGGGNAGAPYQNDFVELYNLSAAAVDLSDWSLQYAAASSAAWQVVPLAGQVPPGGFWLIGLASGGAVGLTLPAPDVIGGLNLAATSGKVALLTTSTALSGACPTSPAMVDFVGYGAANCAESAPAGGLANGTAAQRNGLADTNNNAADFSAAAPSPHNSGLATPTLTPVTVTATPTPSFWPSATPTPMPSATPAAAPPGSVLINEVVSDPQTDWSSSGFDGAPGGGAVSDADEFVELFITTDGLSLAGWTIELLDGSDVSGALTPGGAFQVARYEGGGAFTDTRAGDRLVLGDVRGSGALNNVIVLNLKDGLGRLVDTVTLGAGAPSGSASSPADEAVARVPDGAGFWAKRPATPGRSNGLPVATATPTPTLTATPSRTPSTSPSPTATLSGYGPRSVLLNEVAWAGTAASANDEWIELFNPSPAAISLAGWTLSDGGDVHIAFPAGLSIPAGGYLLLERTDDQTVADIPAEVIYTGGLSNTGEPLTLRDGLGNLIDAVGTGGPWPAGDAAVFATMERVGASLASDGSWRTHSGAAQGRDANGQPLRGTPHGPNSFYLPTPTPQAFPATVVLNEFLPDPDSGEQEFVELFNIGGAPVDLSGWKLDDAPGGSAPFVIPAGTLLPARARLVFFKDETGLVLNNAADTVRLLFPDDRPADAFAYARSAGRGASWARMPDGGAWAQPGDPTPGAANRLASAQPAKTKPSPHPAAEAVPIGTFRGWPVGAWATIRGRVTAPAGLLAARVVYLQDETGGIAVYLGGGQWPSLTVGQTVAVLGYSRRRSDGSLQMYVRNMLQVEVPPVDGLGVGPAVNQRPGAQTAGALVTVRGRVTRLEAQAFWLALDAASEPVRVFFASSTGVKRPKVSRGETWSVTGVVVEMTATTTRAAGYQIEPRFTGDAYRVDLSTPTATAGPAAP